MVNFYDMQIKLVIFIEELPISYSSVPAYPGAISCVK